MQPAYKTTYFRTHEWEDSWVTTAITLARDEWNKNYKPAVTLPVVALEEATTVCLFIAFLFFWCRGSQYM